MADRRAELEKKRQRLAQIRAQKESYQRREVFVVSLQINVYLIAKNRKLVLIN